MRSELEAVLVDNMGNDMSVVNAARVSFENDDDASRTGEQNVGLIKYLAKHNHWTPFAHTAITFKMKAPVPIRTQCFKHKQGFVENEESRRYISSTPEYYVPTFRKSVENKKQGSGEEFEQELQDQIQAAYSENMDIAIEVYEKAIAHEICEEQARLLLPQGCMVNWVWTGSLAAYARFCKQRLDPHAQKEIQDLAAMVSEQISKLYPISWEALTGDSCQ